MNKTIEDRIRSEFPCSDEHWYLGGYLLADGTNVDIRASGSDHRIICGCFNSSPKHRQSCSGWYGIVGMLKRGHIRTTPECEGFEFMKRPTLAQFRAIKEFVRVNDCAETCYFDRLDCHENSHYVGNFYDFVEFLKEKYGEYAYC